MMNGSPPAPGRTVRGGRLRKGQRVYDYRLLLRVLAGFPGDLVVAPDVPGMLQHLADVATDVMGLAGAGVLVGAGPRVAFVTAVPESVSVLERYQEEHQTGPCIAAYRTGDEVLVSDLDSAGETWKDYPRVAGEAGVRAVAGVPMRLGEQTLGALNLYSAAVRGWDADDLEVARTLANIATAHYAMETAMRAKDHLADQLQRALDSRVLIEQAKGVLAEAAGVPPGVAFERMRRWARGHNEKLHVVARRVVEDGLRP